MKQYRKLTYGFSDWGKKIILTHVIKKRMEEKVTGLANK